MTIDIHLLGGFRVVVASHEIPEAAWGRRKARAVVKLLALTPGWTLHRDQLLDLLWPDLAPSAAANNLYQSIHLVRRAFASAGVSNKQSLTFAGEMLRLAPELAVTIDVNEFTAAAAQARATGVAANYRTALAWYGGDLLPDDRYEEWVADRRTALRQTHFDLLGEYAAIAEADGDVDIAIDAWRDAIAADPCHEGAHRALIRLLARCGRRGEALQLYETLSGTLARELGVEPDEESHQLLHAVRHEIEGQRPGAISAGPGERAAIQHNLPRSLTSFVGRTFETGDVRRLLTTARLLTLTGPGGCGKTRLALEVAQLMLTREPDGVWFVDLAPITNADSVAPAVAAVLGLRIPSGQPIQRALAEGIGRRRMLILLDNCEHVIEGSATVTLDLLRHCPGVRIMATSREPLRVAGEVTRLVPSLALPDPRQLPPLAELLTFESVRLFVERAHAVDPAYAPTERETAALAKVCYQLDGMPLAIELAAARLRVLTVEEIAARLDDRFQLLTAADRRAVDRQQTLAATLDWSYDLLNDDERVIFRRLAIFPASFAIAAAEAITDDHGDPPSPTGSTLQLLTSLVEKSLVARETREGEARIRMLETIRQYGQQRLRQSGEEAAIQRRHLEYFLALAEAAERGFRRREQLSLLDRLDLEHDNLRAALGWATADDGDGELALRLAAALVWYWQVRGPLSEGRHWLERALQAAPGNVTAVLAGRARVGLGAVAFFQHDAVPARAALESGAELARQAGDRPTLAVALGWLALLHVFQSDFATGRALAAEGAALCAELDDRWGGAVSQLALCFAAIEEDQTESAIAHGQQALRGFRQVGEQWGSALAARTLGSIVYRRGDYATARTQTLAALELERAMRDPWLVVQSLSLLGEIDRAEGAFTEAETWCRQSLELSRECGHRANSAWSLRSLGFVAAERGDPVLAMARLVEAIALFHESATPFGIACSIAGMAVVAAYSRRPDVAARLGGAIESLLTQLGGRLAPADRLAFERALTAARLDLPGERFEDAWQAGTALSLDQAEDEARMLAESFPPLSPLRI